MNKERELILTAGPSITKKEINYVTDAVKNGWNKNWNSYLTRFEESFAEFINIQHAMTTSSCTGALHLGLLSLGIGEGDEVIVPEITWVATASSVKYTGAEPVFCDIDPVSWCIDIPSLERSITKRTKAIFPVHLYGHPANMYEIMEIAHKYNLAVIEDAAASIGAEIGEKRTGSFGDISGFSFQGAKVLVTGEGGMLVTNRDDLFDRIKSLGDHGRDPNKALEAAEIGYKYKMSNIQAALGLAQLERVDELVNRKREINQLYRNFLGSNRKINVSKELEGCKSIFWMTSIELKVGDFQIRKKFMKALKEHQIDSRPVFSPLSSLPMFKKVNDNPVAYKIGSTSINLPSGHNLKDEEVEYVSSIVNELTRSI